MRNSIRHHTVRLLPSFVVALLATGAVVVTFSPASAQTPVNARWVWFPDGEPAKDARLGKVWFRAEVPMDGPCTGAAYVACDDKFTLWVNGQKVGKGGGDQSNYFVLNGIVERGTNVVAIEAENTAGRAGLLVDGEIRHQGGRAVSFDTPGGGPVAWKCTTESPGDAWLKPQFDVSAWKPVKDLGPHAASPWKDIAFGKSDLDRFQLPPGFSIERIGEPSLVGSVVCITWANRGRLLVSVERGPVLAVWDSTGDGKLDKRTTYTDAVKNCQGLCMVFDDLYAVGDGPQGTGLYKLPDKNDDDVADSVELITKHKGGMGEHGPHNVVFGPDGWLYHNLGNHAWIQEKPQPESPVGKVYEGDLLRPRFEDGRGHARGIPAPGGTIWRFSPDGKKWWLETAGFRNEYDIAFNAAGDLFSFDSDMEWDVGLPWYRPVRINHCIPGANFGWRSGAAKWPDYYFDSLPGTVDIGRGSPTGVVFYEHRQYPDKYRGALLACDWSMGRIIAVFLKPDGCTYSGTFENLVAGNPLNVSDIEVDRGGSVIFSTGGRGTQGGIYRVKYGDGKLPQEKPSSIENLAFRIPQFNSAWAREEALRIKKELGDKWAQVMFDKAKSGEPEEQVRALTLLSQLGPKPTVELLEELTKDDAASVRAFATLLLGDHRGENVKEQLNALLADNSQMVQRRACEAIVRSGMKDAPDNLESLLDSKDKQPAISTRWLRFAARLALEKTTSPEDLIWFEVDALKRKKMTSASLKLLALFRTASIPVEKAVEVQLKLLDEESSLQSKLQWLRTTELIVLSDGKSELLKGLDGNHRLTLGKWLVSGGDLGRETGRLWAALDLEEAGKLPAVTNNLLWALENEKDHAGQVHYALCLAYATKGWNLENRIRLLDWYESTRSWEGGHSMQPYLANIVGQSIQRFPAEDRQQLLLAWRERPFATGLLLRLSQPSEIKDFQAVVAKVVEDVERRTQDPAAGAMLDSLVNALAATPAESSKATLRKLFDNYPDQREHLARALARHPRPVDAPYFIRSLQFGGEATLQIALQALGKLNVKPEKDDAYRSAIVAGLKLGPRGQIAANVLAKWTGAPHPRNAKPQAALKHYQQWYAAKFPTAPSAELPKAAEGAKYTYNQLVNFLENDARGKNGDVVRGKEIFKKANCLKCHQFEKEGAGIGPDLTSVRRRFQRKEIIEAIVLPSAVISDQYKSVTVQTKSGLVHTGMPVPQPGTKNLVLLLPDATKLEIPPDDIDVKAPAKISVMPTGALKELSLQDIADLFAFLETSKSNPITEKPSPQSGR